MAELITTTIPATVTSLRVSKLHLNVDSDSIYIELKGSGQSHSFSYVGQEAATMMQALNKANLTIKSLHRRVMEKLLADGKLTGLIEGLPD